MTDTISYLAPIGALNFAEAIDLETLEPIERVIIRAILQRNGSQYLKINKT